MNCLKFPNYIMLFYTSCFICAVSFLWNASFSLNLKNTYSSFKTKPRFFHLKEVFPDYPCSLHSYPVQIPGRIPLRLSLLYRINPCTLSISSQSVLVLTCITALIILHFHLHLFIYNSLSTLGAKLSFIHFHVSSFRHIVSTKMLINCM